MAHTPATDVSGVAAPSLVECRLRVLPVHRAQWQALGCPSIHVLIAVE